MTEKNFKSISLFTESLIDYAGLFPPAKLDLKTSVENYIKYQTGEYKSMLSKFICPVKLLPELGHICKELSEDIKPTEISLILSGGDNIKTFKENFISDMVMRKNFLESNKYNFRINNFEFKIPEEILTNNLDTELLDLLKFISENSSRDNENKLFYFVETSLLNKWKENIKFTADALEVHNQSFSDMGFKLRTGGVVESAFPSSEQIAYSIEYCLKRNLQMKFTAGLHHPVRHYDAGVNTKMHGFINVFTAGIIAKRHNISEHEMIKLLEDESAANFEFTVSGLKWNGYELENEDIHFARTTFVRSYGSCSFDEPTDDLKKLNLLN